MSIKEALAKAAAALGSVTETPKKEAMLLLAFYMQKELAFVLAHDDEEIDEVGFFKLVGRRSKHEPFEYITSKCSFFGLNFIVTPAVLIPRPETEMLVDLTLREIDRLGAKKVADVGVGSGAIVCSLAINRPECRFVCTDISADAIDVARANAEKLGVAERIEFICCDTLSEVAGTLDLVVSNPPYIAHDYPLPKNLHFEPIGALFAEDSGTAVLKKVIVQAKKLGAKAVLCEMGYDQKTAMEAFFKEQNIQKYEFYKDLAGFDRGFTAWL